MTNKELHENENYIVKVGESDFIDHTGAFIKNPTRTYWVVNKETCVVELKTGLLAHAISEAEQANAYLVTKQWKWIRAKYDEIEDQKNQGKVPPLSIN